MQTSTRAVAREESRRRSDPSKGFLDALGRVRRPVIVGHVTPDADCLGSMFGLAQVLRTRSVGAVAVLPHRRTAKKLHFMLDLCDRDLVVEHVPAEADSAIVVDTASAKRSNVEGGFEALAHLPSFVIDHHMTNPDFATHNWVDPHAASTSGMVYRLASLMRWTISPTVASLLYAGVHGDTAGFSLPNTTAEELRIASELLTAGADVSHIGEQLCRSQGRHDFELLRRVYDHTHVTDDGRIAYSFLSYADITESGCTADDIDDQVSIPRALKGIRIAMLFTEGEAGVIRVNLRGEGQTSVLEIAEHFGGGGHAQSAGIRVRHASMDDVIHRLLAAAHAHLDGRAPKPGGA